VIPVYSLLLVCVLPLSLHTRPRVHWASGIPHALCWAEDSSTPRAHGVARSRSRIRNWECRHSEAKQSTLPFCCFMDLRCARNDVMMRSPRHPLSRHFSPTGRRGACHRARIRATRSLAMTSYGRRRSGIGSIRSVNLTIFWHCGHRYFSFRTAWERLPGNEPSMVLAEDARPKGSGNADSQPNVRSSGESGQCRSSRCDSGCVLAHPASWRASASYRPLRAVWADCAWALRGCARSKVPSALQAART
jgi:hypothetical protein